MRVDENPQKRQVNCVNRVICQRVILFAVLACALGARTSIPPEPVRRAAPSCAQQCGTDVDESTFLCLDRCHFDRNRAYIQ